MEEKIKYIDNENCFLINQLIKIDNKYVGNLINKRSIEDIIKLEDNLYYYKGKSLIEILFDISDYKEIKFKNNDTNDYRFNNLEIKYNEKVKFNNPPNVTILETGTPKLITIGCNAGEYRNMYWKVKDTENNIYYMMHINNELYTKFSVESKDTVLKYNNERPTWYVHSSQYIASMFLKDDKKLTIYLHQYIMDVHFEDNTNMKKTIDHINRDKFDNRRENLRFANMSEQNLNKDKQKRQHNACSLPDGIKQSDLPKYVTYNKRCYDKINNSWREFFHIENHPKYNKGWSSSKSNKILIKDKLDQVLLKLKHINGEISDNEYKKLSGQNDCILPTYFRLDVYNNKLHLIYDYKSKDNKRYNLKMVLTNNDLQIMLDKFIDNINNKYSELKIQHYELNKSILVDFTNLDNIIEDDNDNQEIIQKPDLPPNFSLYKENDSWYLQFSKSISGVRYNFKRILKTLCIQSELNNIIDEINIKHPTLNIQKYNVINKYDFIDKTLLKEESLKPIMPNNFSICNINNIDYIQFSKTIDDKKKSYTTKIKSADLQLEYLNFVKFLNDKYNFNISNENIINKSNRKTSNVIL